MKSKKTPNEIANEWQVFEIKYCVPSFSKLINNAMVLFGEFVIDILKFDKFLHEKFGNYEDEGKSMRDILSEKYGDDIKDYVEQMVNAHTNYEELTDNQLQSNYKLIKEKYPDALLLFRSGNDYIALNDDADKVAKVCGIQETNTIVKFEYYKLDNYLPKLVRAGNRVAICEELPKPETK